LEDEKALDKVYAQFPALKEVAAEFEAYKADYPRHKLENVAKLFLQEKGLLDTPRIGLEQPTGGTRVAPTSGMTADDVKNLRENNWAKYQDMVSKGLINIS
jgi:hypothetical protein